ncbi:FecR family protein [Snuella lapsa]|uniref:DUF4974 domain-containing protein n=1 Tax=Snuella lapsa TaxID=870481 RepID=A0ABP6YC30_9FLAO
MSEKELNNIIDKYLEGTASPNEIETLKKFENFAENKLGNAIFKSELEKRAIKKDILRNIKKSNRIQNKPVFKLFYKSWYKYAAVIIIGLLATTFLFKDRLFNLPTDITPVIVNGNIEPGTDKATLTLGDGSQIVLEKGNTVTTQNANSDGEQIVYTSEVKDKLKMDYNYMTVPRGGQFHVVLSDGTEVWLNSETQLKYPVTFIEGQTRQVELVYGEAYFDVSPSTEHQGAKFKVFNQSQEVEVLGTEFNIKAYKDETNIYTTLVEGKVLVNSEGNNQTLKPSQQSNLSILDKTISVKAVNVQNEIAWIKGDFVFQHKPLKEIVRVLERWYDVSFELQTETLKDVRFSGELSKFQDLEDILILIKNLKSINNYEINEKTVVLK